MAEVNHEFKSKEKAEGFAEGVEYVNDSAMTIARIDHNPNAEKPWTVVVNDNDI